MYQWTNYWNTGSDYRKVYVPNRNYLLSDSVKNGGRKSDVVFKLRFLTSPALIFFDEFGLRRSFRF
jgi:hypothetical protein